MRLKKVVTLLFLTSICIFGLTACAKKTFVERIPNMNEQEKIETVRNNGNNIQYIINPSEAVQLEAVRNYGSSIGNIKNPSEAVQLEAVRNNGYSIYHIKNPSEAVQLEAVRNNGSSIGNIKNPSEAVQLEAVRNNGSSIQYIKNPNEAVQLEAVRNNGYSIQYIKNPSEAVQLEAVRNNGYSIQYIKNPSEAVKLLASKTIKNLDSSNKVKIKEFTLSDNNIKIEVINDYIYSISNLTTQFIEVKTISFYYKEGIYSIDNINLPPKSSKEVPFNDSRTRGINANELVNFGFAINYLLNGKSIDLYKVKQYPIVEFIYKR